MDADVEVNATISGEQIAKTLEYLRKNGLSAERAETVLQEIGFMLLGADLLPEGMV